MNKKAIKIIFINFFIFMFLIISFEFLLFLFFKIYTENNNTGFLYKKVQISEDRACYEMIYHPITSLTHYHNNNCALKEAYTKGPLIFYDDDNDNLEFIDTINILTLGGSTTDGFFKSYSNGKSYPYLLQNKCQIFFNKLKIKCNVINAGSGSFGTSKELLRLVTEIVPSIPDIDLIISLSGINDIYNYDSFQSEFLEYPFLDYRQLNLLNYENFPKINKLNSHFFPNIRIFINKAIFFIKSGKLHKNHFSNAKQLNNYKYQTSLLKSYYKKVSDKYLNNLKIMHSVSKGIYNANYISFLQPTLGLDYNESPPKNSYDNKLLDNIENHYRENLNRTYTEIRSLCKNLSYCYDISDKIVSEGDVFSNDRHHNLKGNTLLSELIFNIIIDDNLLKY